MIVDLIQCSEGAALTPLSQFINLCISSYTLHAASQILRELKSHLTLPNVFFLCWTLRPIILFALGMCCGNKVGVFWPNLSYFSMWTEKRNEETPATLRGIWGSFTRPRAGMRWSNKVIPETSWAAGVSTPFSVCADMNISISRSLGPTSDNTDRSMCRIL